MVNQEIQRMTSSGKVKNGVLDPNDLEENERVLLDKYLQYKVRCTLMAQKLAVEGNFLRISQYAPVANLARNLSLVIAHPGNRMQ